MQTLTGSDVFQRIMNWEYLLSIYFRPELEKIFFNVKITKMFMNVKSQNFTERLELNREILVS